MAFTISSTRFDHEGEIPVEFTCEGADIAPPIAWGGVPEEARSLVLIVDDPDAPDPEAPKMTWVHWLLYNLPADSEGLPEGCGVEDLPEGTGEGLNDWERTGYGGPCPPIGRHRYFFKLYALDVLLEGLGEPAKPQLEAAMTGHVVVETVLMGSYIKGENRE